MANKMTPKDIVKNYKDLEIVKKYKELEDELYTKALKFLRVTLLEQGWGKTFESLDVEDDSLVMVIRDSIMTHDHTEYYHIKFNDELEVVV